MITISPASNKKKGIKKQRDDHNFPRLQHELSWLCQIEQRVGGVVRAIHIGHGEDVEKLLAITGSG